MANPDMKSFVCCKCEKRGSKFCNGCDLYYCTDCCNQRHRKGSFLRHSIVQVDSSPLTCDECNTNAAILKCVACELDLCSSCCQEVHKSGTMQNHVNEGYFRYFGSPTDEAEVIGSGLSQAISGPVRKPDIFDEFDHSDSTNTRCQNDFSAHSRSSTLPTSVAQPSQFHLPAHNWSNWEMFSPDSKGLKEYAQWITPADCSNRVPSGENARNITEKYQSLNSLPAVNSSLGNTAFSGFMGSIFSSDTVSGSWNMTVRVKDICQKVDDIFVTMSCGDQPSRSLMIRSRNRCFQGLNYELIFEFLKNFGDIQDMFSDFIDYGFVLVTYYDINASIQAQSVLSASGISTSQQIPGSTYLEVPFSISLINDVYESPSIIVLTPLIVPIPEVHQFCCQWGNVATVDHVDGNLSSFIVEYCDIRRAKKALNEINGLIHWGGELRTDAVPFDKYVDVERLERFKRIVSSHSFDNSGAVYHPHNLVSDNAYMQIPTQTHSSNLQEPTIYPTSQNAPENPQGHYYSPSFSMTNAGRPVKGQNPPVTYSPWAGFGSSIGMNMRSVHPIPAVAFQSSSASQYQSGHNNSQQRGGDYVGKRLQNRSSDARQSSGRNDQGAGEFSLNINNVKNGVDKRTTLMIRNIPNKYTQHMLLAEINESHKELYDFFYLPIDFKNKCNMGYAFINFIEYSSILPFYQEFSNQKWKNFNSEKVCAISYARLQGKAAMIARFQNSSLLDKDESYRPLVFFSSGANRGKSEPFPVGKITRKHTDSDIIGNLSKSSSSNRDDSQCNSSRSSFPQMVELDQAIGPRVQPAQ